MKVLVLGVTGMLGSAVFRHFSTVAGFEVVGTARDARSARYFAESLRTDIRYGIDVEKSDSLVDLFARERPDVVVNCVGLIKQLADANDPLVALPINSMLPHRLAALCALSGARLIHVSTDCVFSGSKGGYVESDVSDATDLYGKSKYIGEVGGPHAVTLRTSIIGHELGDGANALLGWFLKQDGTTRGYRKAVFSGFPTVELARIMTDYVIPRPDLNGLYHVAAKPINKYDLLSMVARVYGKTIEIQPFDEPVIDRSLDASRFNKATGYVPPEWHDLITKMFNFK